MHPQVFFIVVHMTVTMTLAIVGNLFLVFVIWRGNKVVRRRVSPVQILLLHTCLADLLFALLCLGTEILLMINYPKFSGPAWLCKLVRYGQMVPLYASPFLLVAISADRYQAICRPLAHFRHSRYRRPNCLALLAWTLALICSTPQLLIWGKFRKQDECGTYYGHNKSTFKNVYVILFNTFAWLLPSIMAGIFYYCVCKAVWMSHHSKALVDMTTVNYESGNSCVTQDYVTKLRKKSCGFRRQDTEFDRKRVQTVRLTMTIIACNFFLWAPFCIVNVLQAIFPGLLSAQLIIYGVILGNLNSCVNPWIYILFNRSHVRRALCGKASTALSAYDQSSNRSVRHVTTSSNSGDTPLLNGRAKKRLTSARVSFDPTFLSPTIERSQSTKSVLGINGARENGEQMMKFRNGRMMANGEQHALLGKATKSVNV